MTKKLIGFEYPPKEAPAFAIAEEVEIPVQVRICYMGSFVHKEEAEAHQQEFYDVYGKDIEDGNLIVIQDDILELNTKFVTRIMAENAQGELNLG